jgi:hypothetical protein
MLAKGVVLLHNARPHTAAHTNALIKLFNWAIFDHSPYSLVLPPSDQQSLHQDEVLVGYPALPYQQRARGWSQQLAT